MPKGETLSPYINIVIIIIIVCVCAVIAILFVYRSMQNTQERKYYDAAARMIKENLLDEFILNQGHVSGQSSKIMLCIHVRGKSRQRLVFDPQKGVRIGRDPQNNEICIRNSQVSASHCGLYMLDSKPVVQDYHSANGTWIRRGMQKLRVEGTAGLQSGDTLLIGDTRMDICFFEFDLINL